MATITTQDSSLSFLTDTLGGFVSRAAIKLDAFSNRLEGIFDPIYSLIDYGYVTSASDSRIVINGYYYPYPQMTISGSGMTGNSFSISRISYSQTDGLFITMSGSVRGNVYGDVTGTVTRATIGDSEQSVSYIGSISMSTGVGRYSSVVYTLRDQSGIATNTISYAGSFTEGNDGLIRGTVTSVAFLRDLDGAGSGAAQSLMSISGISRDVVLDADSGRPFGFSTASTTDFFTSMMSGADSVVGGAGDDTLYGYDGNDVINGGLGADEMVGGAGDDSYVVDNIGDRVVEASGQGNDTVSASVDHTLADNVERLTLTGRAVTGTGNGLNNVLTGNASANVLSGRGGDDVLDGGAGADTLIGGEGDDRYVLDQIGDVVVEADGEGTDTVQVMFANAGRAAVTLSLESRYAHVEKLEVLGAGLYDLEGNGSANVLIGNGSANVIDGGAGADRMEGGLGNDTYVVDDAGDVVVESAVRGSGVDLVRARLDYVLGANVENLTLEGAALRGEGNELGNVLTGNGLDNALYGRDGNDVLSGGAGNDLLDGGVGIDSMSGGEGDDTYVVDNVRDVVSEGLNAGIDTVRSSINYALGANVENLELTGTALNGTGNALANRITGNELNNRLAGGDGADTLLGMDGNDWLDGGRGLNTLTGGDGADAFYFGVAPQAGTLSTITDFDLADDRFVLKSSAFAGIAGRFGTGETPLAATAFQSSDDAVADTAAVRILYDSSSGALYYDADGSGAGAAVQFAQIGSGLSLDADHFFITTA
ncbi:calcium-binding protein [Methyloversatilis universalis]|nr:calcium-binding protein [Methyloversatilis universalis]